MDLRQLRHFVALSEALNFHRAAKALNLSQPPLTVSIRKLEEELGARLFDRGPRGVVLTDAGQAALPYARDALSAADAVSQAVNETILGRRGRLRIGFVGTATYALIPAMVPRFRASHPDIELTLKEATSLEIVRSLEAGEIDVGLVRTPLLEAGGVLLEPLYDEQLMLITSLDHPLSRQTEVALDQLRDEPFVTYDRAQVPNLWAYTMSVCQAAGFQPRAAGEAANIHTMIALVESGLGVALAPKIVRRAGADRVRHVLLLHDAPLRIGFAIATRRGERRIAVGALVGLAHAAAKQFDT